MYKNTPRHNDCHKTVWQALMPVLSMVQRHQSLWEGQPSSCHTVGRAAHWWFCFWRCLLTDGTSPAQYIDSAPINCSQRNVQCHEAGIPTSIQQYANQHRDGCILCPNCTGVVSAAAKNLFIFFLTLTCEETSLCWADVLHQRVVNTRTAAPVSLLGWAGILCCPVMLCNWETTSPIVTGCIW